MDLKTKIALAASLMGFSAQQQTRKVYSRADVKEFTDIDQEARKALPDPNVFRHNFYEVIVSDAIPEIRSFNDVAPGPVNCKRLLYIKQSFYSRLNNKQVFVWQKPDHGTDFDFVGYLSMESLYSFESVKEVFENTGRNRFITEKCMDFWNKTGFHPEMCDYFLFGNGSR